MPKHFAEARAEKLRMQFLCCDHGICAFLRKSGSENALSGAFSDPYSFENRCLENLTLTLGDETAKIFLNTRGELEDVDEEMLEFLAYIEDTTDRFAEHAKSPLIRQIHQRVTQIRQSREMEVEYMTLMQRDRENIEQGREEGRKEGIQMTLDIIRLHLSGKSSREIADVLDLTPSYVDQILQDYESLPG